MYTLKGFIKIDALANNTPGAVAANGPVTTEVSALGELSNRANTFSIEKGIYQRDGYENVELIAFTSHRDDDARITVPATFTDHVLAVTQWMFEQSLQNRFSSDLAEFERQLLQNFGPSISNLECGKMVHAKASWLPSYMAWTLEGTEDNLIRVWFSDEVFQSQYDDYHIVVVPPIEPVDVFMGTKDKVAAALTAFNLPDLHERVLTKTNREPYTLLVSKMYPWYDREDETATLETTWTVAIYGAAGNNLELIKQALADYILANSAYDRAEWMKVFPDIFTNTEFVIVPMWHNRSVVDETVRASLYSPIIAYEGLPQLVKKFIKYEPATHLTSNLETFSIQYKSIAAAVCGSPENRSSVFKLSKKFPDYAQLSLTSVDLNRMTADTVEWVQKLVEGVIAAEGMDEYSYIGQNVTRITRENIMYAAFSHGDVNYLIVSRKSLGEVLGVDVGD